MNPDDSFLPNCAKRTWVNCPICGESDMRREEDPEGNAIVICVNHACASNGGRNCSALTHELIPSREEAERMVPRWMGDAAKHWWIGVDDAQRAGIEKLPPSVIFALGYACAKGAAVPKDPL